MIERRKYHVPDLYISSRFHEIVEKDGDIVARLRICDVEKMAMEVLDIRGSSETAITRMLL